MKESPNLSWITASIAGWIIAFGTPSSEGRFVDALDNTNNFFGAFASPNNAAPVYATNTAPSEVTLFKPDPPPGGADSGINWRNGGSAGANFSLSTSGSENVLAINPVSPVNGGFYSVQILFFSNGNFVSENTLIPDTNSTAPSTNDIAGFAQSLGVNATDYFVRIRVLPFDFDGADRGFTFTELAAIPEPTPMWLVPAALLVFQFVRRKK
jgi:hypothetical protein